MSTKIFIAVSFLGGLLSAPAWALQAQPVPVPEDSSASPQIDIAGTGIATLGYGRNAEHPKAESGVNFSDSALQVGATQRLYDGGIGSFGFGGITTDDTNKGTGVSFFLYQAFTDFQTDSYEVLIGRSDNPTAHLVDFPTLRSDDLITLTNPLDPFSNGQNIEEHRYSNVASVTFNQNLKYYENIHVQHLISSAGIGTQTGLNSFGFTFQYMAPVGNEPFQRVPFLGLGYEHVSLSANSPSGLEQFYAGGVLNLNESVTDRIDLRFQDLVSLGSDLSTFSTATDTFQANSNTATASVRYFHSPFGKPGYQVSLTAGAKNYFKIANGSSIGGALTGVKRLGEGFDLVAQYQSQWRDSQLALAQANGIAYEQTAEVGLIFNFDATINQHISPRRSMLNQQHQYVPN